MILTNYIHRLTVLTEKNVLNLQTVMLSLAISMFDCHVLSLHRRCFIKKKKKLFFENFFRGRLRNEHIAYATAATISSLNSIGKSHLDFDDRQNDAWCKMQSKRAFKIN